MAKLATCPHCEKQFSLPAVEGTATIACPFCQAHITLKSRPVAPPAAAVVSKEAPQAVISVDDDDDYEDRPRRKKRKPQKDNSETGMKIVIVVGLLLLTAGAIGAIFWYMLSQGKGGNNIEMPQGAKNFPQPPNNNRGGGGGEGGGGDADGEAPGDDDEDKWDKYDPSQLATKKIDDKEMQQNNLFSRFVPETPLPGLIKTPVANRNTETLSPELLKRLKHSTVFVDVAGHGSGSGFFAIEKGHVVTNAHVIGKLSDPGEPTENSISIVIDQGSSKQRKLKATIVKVDRKNDLAYLRVRAPDVNDLPPLLEIASSESVIETQKAFSLGYPYGTDDGNEVTVTQTSVSSLIRQNDRITDVKFAGASLNPGNSGGPIVDGEGRVIAVAVRIKLGRVSGGQAMTNTGISFGVPSEEVVAMKYGRANSIEVMSPTKKDDKFSFSFRMGVDPFTSKDAVAKLQVVVGEEGKAPTLESRDAVTLSKEKVESKTVKTDSNNKQVKVTPPRSFYSKLDLPPLPEGKVYWLFPQLLENEGDNTPRNLEPISYKPNSFLSLETLVAGNQGAMLDRCTMLARSRWSLSGPRSAKYYSSSHYKTEWKLKENSLYFADVGSSLDERAIPFPILRRWWTYLDNPTPVPNKNRPASLTKEQYGKKVFSGWLKLLNLNMPTKELEVGSKWTTEEFNPGFDFVSGKLTKLKCTANCEFNGIIEKDDKKMAVIRVQGSLVDAASSDESMTTGQEMGTFDGYALVDAKERTFADMFLRGSINQISYESIWHNVQELQPLTTEGRFEFRFKGR